jgi:signal transduction histidine kinase
MDDYRGFRHLGGGRKGCFLLLRYLFITTASYLLILQTPSETTPTGIALMISAALASNVALSFVPAQHLFSWYLEAPVLVADTLWVSLALHATGAVGQEFFLLYFFVLFLAMLGENLPLLALGSGLVSAASLHLTPDADLWTAANLLRIVFFYIVAIFYGHVLGQIRAERERADRSCAWARELEAKVAERTQELTRLYEQCLAANRLKSEFVANMSHELRTPLNVILGYTEMLLDEPVAPGREQYAVMVQRIRGASETLLQLVDNVLDLRKLETGKMPVQCERMSLVRFLDAFRRRERMPLTVAVRLEWNVDARLPEIETDPAKLTIVLDNLVNNALKFTTAGTITVTATDLPDDERVRFRVEDTGRGIPAAQLGAIFEPFRQLTETGEHRQGGVGLGLAIVRRYVALLAGEITVRSEEHVGTAFEVTLPYRHGSQPAVAATPSQPRFGHHLRVVPTAVRAHATGFATAEILAGGALALTVLAAIQSFGRTQLGQLASQSAYAESQTVTRTVLDRSPGSPSTADAFTSPVAAPHPRGSGRAPAG